jgi:hypothetical protein
MGQSSPGNLHLLHVPSKLTRQIPHVSSDSSGRSHFHVATARKELIVTFIVGIGCEVFADVGVVEVYSLVLSMIISCPNG